jgi:DNA-directed RNA polymerase delta subunit
MGFSKCVRQIADEEWIKTLKESRKVKFIYQELPEDGKFINAES